MKPHLAALALLAPALSAQATPSLAFDLGTQTARLQVLGPTPGKPLVLVAGTALLGTPLTFPGATGALHVDPSSGLALAGLTLDGLGRLDLGWTHTLPRGVVLHLQAATVESLAPLDVRIAPLASDAVPASDGLFLDHFVDAGTRGRYTVPEIVALPGGGYRLWWNGGSAPGGIGSATSQDGLTFTTDPGVRVPHPNATQRVGNAAPLVLPDGRLRLYYIQTKASGAGEEILSAVSTDWLTFTVEAGVRYAGAANDNGRLGVPDLVWLDDGRLRLYHQGDLMGLNNVRSAISTDGGLTFAQERVGVLPDATSGPRFVDADVVRLRDGRWRCLAMRAGSALYAFTSVDGLLWTLENAGSPVVTTTMLANPSATSLADPAQLLLADGSLRTYFHDSNFTTRSSVTTSETGRGNACPGAVLCTHDVRVATSQDGLAWTPGPILLTAGSVPAPVRVPDGRLLVYYVDGTTKPEHLGVFDLRADGSIQDQRRVTVLGGPSGASRLVDPAPVVVSGQVWLYCTVLGTTSQGISRGRLDATGTVLAYEGIVVPPTANLVDPDVILDGLGLWHMWVFGSGLTAHLTSSQGTAWTKQGDVTALAGQGFTQPQPVSAGWRLYTFSQNPTPPNTVDVWTSADLLAWTGLATNVLAPPPGRVITDPQVVADGAGGYVMVYKTQ